MTQRPLVPACAGTSTALTTLAPQYANNPGTAVCMPSHAAHPPRPALPCPALPCPPAGASAYTRNIDYKRVRAICDKVGARLCMQPCA